MTNLLSPAFLGSSIATFSIGFWAYAFDRKSKMLRRWFLFCLSVAFWSFGLGILTSSTSIKMANFFYGVHYIGAIHIPFCFLLFVKCYFHQDLKFDFDLLLCYGLALLQLGLFFSGQLVGPLTPKWHFTFYTNPAQFYWLFMGYFFLYTTYSFFLMFTSVAKMKLATEKKSRLFFLLATALGYAGGSSAFLLVYDVNLPPYGIFLFLAFPLITTYSIVRYKFLDIEVIIKRTLVFAGLLAMVMAVVAVISAVVNGFVARWFAIPPNMVAIGSALAVIVVFDPTRQFLIRVTDRFLFQKKSEIKDILNRLSESVVTIFDLDQIGHTILSTLGETLRLESGGIILRNKKAGNYRLLEHFGIVDDNLSGCVQGLMSDTTIGDYFATHNRTILSLDHVEKQTTIPAAVSHWLQVTKARVCVPLFISEEQFGLMVLGKKKSDQEFSQDEIDFFPAIATQTSLALRNALLIETVVEEREEKVKAQHEAKRVHYAELLAHEVKNAVTAADLQARSLYEQVVPKFKLIQKKFFSEGLPPVAVKEYEKMCQKITDIGYGIQDRCKKIRVITKTAQHHLSSDLSIFEEIYIKMLWEDAITESCVKNVTFDFHGPADKDFYVFGNPVLLQRVFINLIKNADDAMTGQADKRVALFCDFREVDSKQVAYFRFQDNGPGFQKESAEKIFHRGFSTKPKPQNGDVMASGLGYGLYSCKENIEEFHHGKMWAETPEGGGACFVFWIPMEHKASI